MNFDRRLQGKMKGNKEIFARKFVRKNGNFKL
jgi:hypothetical protein